LRQSRCFFKTLTAGEIELIAAEVGNPAAGLLNDAYPRGVVPDFFAVAARSRQAQIDRGVPAGDGGIFCLAVDPEERGGDAGSP
jgi:hypothetical protein